MSTSAAALAHVPDVDVSPAGTFKYVLLEVTLGGSSKTVVRGYDGPEFHKGVRRQAEAAILADPRSKGATFASPGGGRIRHDPASGKCFVYGFSNAYGRGDHSLACELLRRHFPAYANVHWSNDGY